MRPRDIIVFGASSHGKVVGDIVIASGVAGFRGYVDDNPVLTGQTILGFPVLGDSAWLRRELQRTRLGIVPGVGDNFARQRICDQCAAWGAEIVSVIHPSAIIAGSVRFGAGVAVMAGAVINPEAVIGRGAIVNTGAVIEHEVELAEYAHAMPHSTVAGKAKLGAFSQVSMGASVFQCVSIGERTVVGAGAVVTRDLPADVVAFGVPARIRRPLATPVCVSA